MTALESAYQIEAMKSVIIFEFIGLHYLYLETKKESLFAHVQVLVGSKQD